MANFKDSYRLERVYFEKLKSMISILKSFLENETDEKTRAILSNEIDDNGAILLLYRNLGEAWAELADLIQKLRNDLNDLDEKEEAYHDELNERIDEVNNYLMALIRALEARMNAVESDLAQMGRLFTYDLAETSGVYSLTESGTAVTFADTVSKLTHVRPHFVSVRNGSKYYLIDTYDLTAGTGAVTWSGFEFTPTGEIKETIVTLAADNSVSVTQTSTNFAAILSRLTAIETKITNFGDLPSNASANVGDVLTKGESGNEWKTPTGGDAFLIEARFNETTETYELYHNNVLLTLSELKNAADNKYVIVYVTEYDEEEETFNDIYFLPEKVVRDNGGNIFNYDLMFVRKYLTTYSSLGLNSVYFDIFISNYNYDEDREEEIIEVSYDSTAQNNEYYCVVEHTSFADIFSADVSSFRVYYNSDYNIFSVHHNTPNSIQMFTGETNGVCYVIKKLSATGIVSGVTYPGVLFTFTNFTFTNGVLNTRSLFLYEGGIAEYTPVN